MGIISRLRSALRSKVRSKVRSTERLTPKSTARSIYEKLELKKREFNEAIDNPHGYTVDINGGQDTITSNENLPWLSEDDREKALDEMEICRKYDRQRVGYIDSLKKDIKANRNVVALECVLEGGDIKLPKVPSEVTRNIVSLIPTECFKLRILNKSVYEKQKKADKEYTMPPEPNEKEGPEWEKYKILKDAFKGINEDSPAR